MRSFRNSSLQAVSISVLLTCLIFCWAGPSVAEGNNPSPTVVENPAAAAAKPVTTFGGKCHRAFVYLALGAGTAFTIGLIGSLGGAVYHKVQASAFSKQAVDISSLQNGESRARSEALLQKFIQGRSLTTVFDFTSVGVFGRAPFAGGEAPHVDLPRLKQLREEILSMGMFKELYVDAPHVRESFVVALDGLIEMMEKHGVHAFYKQDLTKIAETQLAKLKQAQAVGELYTVHAIQHPRLLASWAETVAVDAKAQKEIDALFSVELTPDQLSASERILLQSEEMTLAEIAELRAIRKATELFEKATYLKDDLSGTLLNNIWSESCGGKQQVCSDEANTYSAFIETLGRRGLVRSFVTFGVIGRTDRVHGGHAATLLVNPRTKKRYVLDSWHEKGGTAAHITTRADWLSGRDTADIVSLPSD